ncbi:hypothetical protein DFR68_101659 [Nocardia mexicana]|uniref:Uncharacterized protein n=1 Tax=Nocardia mexicana TaxID=279262 RepID=A0A370HF39_9NOCA|nr:hypothetical protein DFR68_101659 [Nocardia mexicana]
MSIAAWVSFVALVAVACAFICVLVRAELGNSADDEKSSETIEFGPYSHAAPGRPFTVAQAHEVMQLHRGCCRRDCPRKWAAYRVLRDAGRLRPDSGRGC